MTITCLLCSKSYEDTDSGIQNHFNQEHYPNGVMYYVIALQKKIEEIDKRTDLGGKGAY